MPEAIGRRLWLAAFVLLCAYGSLAAAWQMRDWGDALSPVDSYSEANAIREVRNFLEQGIGANYGLGNVYYRDLYPTAGFVSDPQNRATSLTPSGVYTHYPPGPEYLLFAAMKLLGPEPVVRLRLLPVVLCGLAAIFFGLRMRRRFGPPLAWVVMAACAALPAFGDANSYLHYVGYAFALLLVEIGLCLGFSGCVLPFLLVGFLQGWLSFDYVFLVTLAPAAMELLLTRLHIGHTPRPRIAALRCLAAGGGFALAHVLHFAEVWAFFGSFQAAWEDFRHAASYRAGSPSLHNPLTRLAQTYRVLHYYFITPAPIDTWVGRLSFVHGWHKPSFRFLGVSLGVWWLALSTALVARNIVVRPRNNTGSQLVADWLAVSLSAFLLSSLWLVVMLNHAIDHPHFLYRHLFFGYLACALFVAVTVARWARAWQFSLRDRWSEVAPAPVREA